MKEAYGRVIDLITEGELDFRAIGLALAKANPAAFLAVHDHVSGATNTTFSRLGNEIVALMASGRRVDAIKMHRANTGVGLKESKDFVEELYEKSLRVKVASNESRSITGLGDLLKNILTEAKERTSKYSDEGAF